MNSVIKLLRSCSRQAASRQTLVAKSHRDFFLYEEISTVLHVNTLRGFTVDMAQRSITSFFSKTPKKSIENDEQSEATKSGQDVSPSSSKSKETPKSNGAAKKNSSKRQRIESSGSESKSPIKIKQDNSPVSTDKKSKVKRPRIERSDSEPPSPAASPQKITVKVEKHDTPAKTYVSPKNKKNKDVSPSSSKSEGTPQSNGAAKKNSSKRQRIESSGSESKSPIKIKQDNSPASTDKKSKLKRPRIESSDSEPPSPAASPQKITVKVENDTPAKTYASPKTKKNKVQEGRKKEDTKEKTPLAEKNKVESKNKESKRKSKTPTPKKEKAVKTEDIENDDTADKIVPEEAYNPSKERYHPIKDACWPRGKEVPYLALAKTLEAIEGTSARLKMIEILSNYFRSVIVLTPDDLLPSVYMCLNQLAPAYHSLELGIAETYLMKAIGQCTGRTLAQVKSAAQKTGDLGLVAEQARATQRTMFASPPLKLRKVFAALKEIAHMTGQASVNKKISKIQSLYVACRLSEARYLIRSLAGKLRIGLAEQSVLQALSLSTATTPPGQDVLDVAKGKHPEDFKAILDENALIIKTTYCECPNYDLLIPVLLEHGVAALPDHCKLTPGVPLKPMLAHPTKGVHEVFNRFEGLEFTCEYKYDGERAQIHVPSTKADVPTSVADVPTSDADVPTGDADVPTTKADLAAATIFSRNQENNTSKYPDILRRLPGLLKESVQSCVLDCESVAFDVVNNQILPFQILSTRKRKDATESEIKVQVCVFVFDLLYLNGRALVKEPFSTRRRLLHENFNEVQGEWQFATAKDCSTIEEVQLFLDESVKGSCEGLMVKTLKGKDATYEIARRSRNWLKLKKDYLDGVGDSLDVVVIGGYSGRGKRAGVYGGFLLACYDPDAEEYQSLCKIGTGFTDEDLQTLSKKLEEHVIEVPRGYYRFDPSHVPDAWFAPAAVWEVRCADLSLSPAHRAAAGAVEPGKGISLRFPRFIRERDDKTPEQATSAQQVAELYLAQDQVKNQTAKPSAHDDFY